MIKDFLSDIFKAVLLLFLGLVLISNKDVNLASANFSLPTLTQVANQVTNPAPIVSSGNGTSRNWAGYMAQNGNYTSVTGTWVVPQISGGMSGSDAAWVGIGGIGGHDLIQVGTQESVSRNGQVFYEAFYETLPNVSQPLSININGGDSVTASVSQIKSGQWQIYLIDDTNGQSAQVTTSYDSSLSSAEWIEEAPSGSRNILPLDSFGTVNFTQGSTVKNNQSTNILGAGGTSINMANAQGQVLASTSSLGSDGQSFSVTRTSTPSTGAPSGFSVRRGRSDGDGDDMPHGFVIRTFHFRF